jgi:4-diphosphocytidyl-2-C-methyl-D-erythritol kinase
MVAVDLFDNLTFTAEPGHDIRLTCDDPTLPTGPDNLVWRAADLLRRHAGRKDGVHVHLTKRVPAAAGLAGGSSDAAATLRGLDRFWGLNLTPDNLAALAAGLGSDVAFFLSPPAAWCTGRGEIVRPFSLRRPLHLVLACPSQGLRTADVYREARVPARPVSPEGLAQALEAGDAARVGAALFNRLQGPAEALCPAVVALREAFERLRPAGHLMSGSGSSYFALARSQAAARQLARRLRQEYRGPDPEGLRVFVVKSL